MPSETLALSCHCGNIAIRANHRPATLTQCNCSICRRYAALWGYFFEDEVIITEGDLGSSYYSWGDRILRFVRCNGCGCMTHHILVDKTMPPKLGVNFRMAEADLVDALPVRHFDGAESWKFFD